MSERRLRATGKGRPRKERGELPGFHIRTGGSGSRSFNSIVLGLFIRSDGGRLDILRVQVRLQGMYRTAERLACCHSIFEIDEGDIKIFRHMQRGDELPFILE